MRILHVSTFALPDTVGGTQVLLSSLSRTLHGRGHQVTILRHDSDPSAPDYTLRETDLAGVTVLSLNHRFRDCRDFRGIYRNDRVDRIFAGVLDRVAPDVVHIHHLTCLSTGILAITRQRGVPTVLTLFDFWLGCPRGQRIQDDLTLCTTIDREQCTRCCARLWPNFLQPDDPAPLLEYDRWIRERLHEVDVITTLSRDTRDEYLAWGLDHDDIRIVEPGLDHERFAQRRHRRRPGHTFRLAFVGTVFPSKGVHVAVEAVQRLDPARFTLDVHGDDPPWHNDVGYGQRLRAADRGTHRIRFHGRYDNRDLPGLLSEADVLIVPSLWNETYCLTLREGFLAGVPVVASRLGAMAEGVVDGETGLLFTPGDPADLAARVQQLYDDRDLYERVASSPKSVPTTDRMTDDLLAVYADAAS
ncbi:MAG TPA: glycosyltransferase family 4 protein [Planctomycetota bacterium]|nr:glycosyltransferase family 4 protein [Planctomycetota bacterium]